MQSHSPTAEVLDQLVRTIDSRLRDDPGRSYVARLHAAGIDAVLKKVGEEATELVLAAKGGDRAGLVHETADLWFHVLIALRECDVHPREVLDELARRRGRSGLDEKAARGSPAAP